MTRAAVIPTLVVALALAGCPFERTSTETSGSTAANEPRPEDTRRIRELEAENRRLRALARAAEGSGDAPPVETEPPPANLEDAIRLREDGDAAAAVQLGLEELDRLNDLGIDAPRLALILGEWALEADEPGLAERLFREAGAAAEAGAEIVGLAAGRESVARAAALGPDAAALAEAEALREAGDPGGAATALQALIADGEDDAVVARAEKLQASILDEASELAIERLDRSDALLAGPGPWDVVGELLDGVESLPEGTWDTAEVRRLRAWYRTRSKEAGSAAVAVEQQRLQDILDAARTHVAAERYRDAVVAYRRLEGSALQTQARDEARTAVDTLVKAERERAAKLFVAARKKPDASLKKEALEEVAVVLRGLLEEFPDSTYAGRVRDNLTVVEKELAKML